MALDYWIVPHTHWDREWYLSFQDLRWRLVGVIDGIVESLDADGRFSHFMLDGQSAVLEDYLEFRPERRADLERLLASGRLAAGPWYVQPDDLLPSGEALVRNLERGIALARSFGEPMMVGYLPDSFGHSGSLPSILRGFGIASACLMRGPGKALNRCLFEWEARDGSKVLVAYLIDGYNNGVDLAVEGGDIVDALALLRERQAAQGALLEGLPVLAMNGYDHRPIEAGLPRALEEAGLLDGESGPRARIGSLAGYIEAASLASTTTRLPQWRGELRSTYRCPITAGCASTRQWIKAEDQGVSALLETQAEPLAALASWALGSPWPAAALDSAWKFLLLNQAHDSICGCSIDRVHEDMRYRFAQARSIASNVAASAAEELARAMDTRAASDSVALVVLNPAPGRGERLVGLEYSAPPTDPVVVGPDGVARPVQVTVPRGIGAGRGGSSLFFDQRFKPSQVKLALGMVRGGVLMNYRVTGASSSWESAGLLRVELELSDSSKGSAFEWEAWVESLRGELQSPELRSVRAIGRRAGPATLLFKVGLPDFGAASYAFRSSRPGESRAGPGLLSAGPAFLENEFYRLRVLADGSLGLLDKGSGARYRGLNELVDGGDRGDEYNYDRPPRDLLVRSPSCPIVGARARTRLLESGPLRATLLIESVYRFPASLDGDRVGRSRRRLPHLIRRFVSLTAGSRRIEFRTEFDNLARDHRLRAHFPLPGLCPELEAGGTFEILRRPSAAEAPLPGEELFGPSSDTSRELPPTTHPFAGLLGAPWSVAETGARGGLALLALGLREYEALELPSRKDARSELCLTLLRCVGSLSRGDLSSRSDHAGPDIPTPAAQELGPAVFEYALATYEGELSSSGLCEEWADYRSPPAAIAQGAHPGKLGPRASLLNLDAEGLVFSSLRLAPGGALRLRLYDILGKARRARLCSALPLSSARTTRLDGRPVQELEIGEDGVSFELELSPYQILTIELQAAAPGRPSFDESY